MIRLRQAIVVEGRYDKHTLAQLVDAPVFTTEGFGILNNRAKLEFLRQVARRRGLIILTDSDGAGFVIRKRQPGKEGKLGVEGMSPAVLLEALHRAGVTPEGEEAAGPAEPLSFTDLYEAGLSGTADSAARRLALMRRLGLPEHMGKQALLDALNILLRRDEFFALIQSINEQT